MGKIAPIFIFLLMVSIVGYIITTGMVEEGLEEGNIYISENSMLTKYYKPTTFVDGHTEYLFTNDSGLFTSVPQQTPSSLIQEGISFVDRIFILFSFVKTILGVILFPLMLVQMMGLPWQLNMLLFPPLITLYIFGIIDLFSGGDS